MAAPVPDTFEVRINWTLGGSPWAVNVLHYLVPASAEANQANADALAAEVLSDFNAADSISASTVTAVILDSVGVRDIRTANQPEFIGELNEAGDNAGSRTPPQLSIVCTLRTALAGRSYRGRIYTGGFGTGGITAGGGIDPSLANRVAAWGGRLQSYTIDGGLWVLGVTSRKLGVTTPVTSAEVRDDVWDWQRSRATVG